MATAEIYLKKVGTPEANGGRIPVMSSETAVHEIKTLSGSSQQTAAVPADGANYVWVIKARGGALRVLFGTNPTASDAATGGFLIEGGEQREFGARPGEKAAVIAAA